MEGFPSFEERDFWLDISSVTIGPQIGEGQFSTVYIGKYFGDFVAVKKQTRIDKDLDNYLLRELAVLKNASHPNLVNYIGACNEVSEVESNLNALYIVTEFCQGGDLLGLLLSDHELGWKFRIKIATDAASALKYLHRHNFIHRDIKSSNMLLDHNWTCKLSDFGMARDFGAGGTGNGEPVLSRRMTICGTNEYMAPELMFDEEYGSSVDVFSFGMVLLEIMKRVQVGKTSFAHRKPQDAFVLDREQVQADLPDDAPPSLVMLALQCCEYEVADRPFSDDVYDWLSDLYESYEDDCIPAPPMKPVDMGEDEADDAASVPPSPVPPLNSASPIAKRSSAIGQSHEPLTEKKLRELYALNEGGPNTVLKAGYIYKRNKTGFRNWKFRWLVLTPYQLRWYAAVEDRVEKGHIELLDAKVKRTKQYRFVVLDPKEDFHHDPSTQYHREFSADGEESMLEWIDAIQLAIDNYQRLRTASRTSVASPRGADNIYTSSIVTQVPEKIEKDGIDTVERLAGIANAGGPVDISAWLAALKLDQYTDNFLSRGYDNLQHLVDFGIQNDDLDYMGISHPLHRRVLRIAATAEYSAVLQTAIPEWQEVGSVVVYKVVSRWRFARSCVLLRYGDFQKLHSNVLRTLTGPECSKLQSKLPELPGKGMMVIQSRSASFCNQRRAALESYLLALSSLLCGTPMMRIVLETLGLAPRSVGATLEARKRVRRSDFSPVSTEFAL